MLFINFNLKNYPNRHLLFCVWKLFSWTDSCVISLEKELCFGEESFGVWWESPMPWRGKNKDGGRITLALSLTPGLLANSNPVSETRNGTSQALEVQMQWQPLVCCGWEKTAGLEVGQKGGEGDDCQPAGEVDLIHDLSVHGFVCCLNKAVVLKKVNHVKKIHGFSIYPGFIW